MKDEIKQPNGESDSAGDAVSDVNSQAAELQTAIKEMVDSGTLPGAMSAFLARLGFHIAGLNDQLSSLMSGFANLVTLSTQYSAVADRQGIRLTELDEKVSKLCKKFGIHVPSVDVGGAVSPASQRADADSGAARDKLSAKSAEKPAAEDLKEKFPNIVIISGMKDPLAPAFEFSFRIGDLVFGCMEQALFYIKYQFMKRLDLAARVKKAVYASEMSQIGTIATSDEWSEVEKDVAAALMQLRVMQCKEFEEKIQAAEAEHTFIFSHGNAVYGSGCPRSSISKLLPDKFPGKNLYGVWLTEFCERYRLGLPGELPFDVKKYCIFEQVPLSDDKEKILVLGDIQLSGFKERLNTKLIVDPTMSCVQHPKDESHTAKAIIEKLPEDDNLEQCAAIVLLFGTYEVGKSPDKLETDYTQLLKMIREKAPHVAIFVGSALPRTDKFQDQLKLTNYAIGIATRTMDDPKVIFLDISEKFSKLPNQNTLFKANGFQLTETGADKLTELLAAEVPFVSVVPPKKPNPQASSGKSAGGRGRTTVTSAGGPAAKRARRVSSSSSLSYRGGSAGGGRGSSLGYATPGYGGGFTRSSYQSMMGVGSSSYSPWSAGAGSVGGGFSSVHGTLGSQLGGGQPNTYNFRYDY